MPLTPSRALRRPRRIDMRAVLGVFVTLVAFGGSLAFWTLSSDARGVVVATRDLPATTILGAPDLAVSQVRVDDAIYQTAIPASELSSLVGKPLAEPVHAQQMLVRAQVAPRPPLSADRVALTIAVSPETAVGGRLRPGDSVQVLVTLNKGKPDTRTSVVLPRVSVYDVGYDQWTTAFSTDAAGNAVVQGPTKWVTLTLTPEQARQLAEAKWSGDLDVALLPPQQ
ncbi:MAG: Flp pilus assembly protein CpaB [Anaerolineae bacterium]